MRAIINTFASILILTMATGCLAKNVEYSIIARPDGGYSLTIIYQGRSWMPITPEGFFPKEKRFYTVDLIGQGLDLSIRNQKGYYYSVDQIKCKQKAWDFGYAWIDNERKYLHFNFYWVSEPNSMTPSEINGKYILKNEK